MSELAVMTNTTPGQWWREDEQDVLTMLEVLEERARAAKRKR